MRGESRRAGFAIFSRALVLGLALAPAATAGVPAAVGPVFEVGRPGATEGPVVAMNERGESAVLWLGDCAGSGFALCLRAFDAAGAPRGPEVALDLRSDLPEVLPAAALTSRGILWLVVPDALPLSNHVAAYRYTLGGVRMGGGSIASRPPREPLDSPAVAVQPGGGAVVVWRHGGFGADPDRVRMARLGPEGEGIAPGALVGSSEAGLADPQVASAAGGEFLIAWRSGDEIFARGYTAGGDPRGDATAVAPGAGGPQGEPALAVLPDGEGFVAWRDLAAAGDAPSLFGRGLTAAGAGTGPLRPLQETAAAGASGVRLAGLAGGFAASWIAREAGGVDAVYLRALDPAGVPGPPEATVVEPLTGDARPALAADGAGTLVAAWRRLLVAGEGQTDPTELVFARRYVAASEPCLPDSRTLCLGEGRFAATVAWRDPRSGDTGAGRAQPATGETGFFTFFGQDNLELVVKTLDGRAANGFHWLFYGALTDVDYTLTMTDTASGERRFYDNPPGEICGRGDTRAFPLAGPAAAQAPAAEDSLRPVPLDGVSWWALADEAAAPAFLESPPAAGAAAGACAAGPEGLCLFGGRFLVEAEWLDHHNGGSGTGRAVPFSDESGLFWFFSPANLELVVKILDGRPVNGRFWVFYGALSDVEYTIRVTDTETGEVATYRNPPGQICGRGDTAAF